MSRSTLRGMACALGLVGCGGSGPSDAMRPSSVRAPLAEDEVLVTSTTRFHTSVGIAERREDLSANPPEIYLQEGASFTRITGSPVAGGWRFTGVPRTEYYLRTNPLERFDIVTSARHVDIGTHRMGRPDAVYPRINEVSAQLALRNLSPWRRPSSREQPGSSLQAVAMDVELLADILIPSRITEGATTIITDNAFLYAYNPNGVPVLQAGAGDRMYLHQLSEFLVEGLPNGRRLGYSAIDRSLLLEPFDYVPDLSTPLPITAVLQPVPLQELTLDWRLSGFASQAPLVHPRALARSAWFEVHPTPRTSAAAWQAETQPLLRLNLPEAETADFTFRLRFGNPYPSDWGLAGKVSYSHLYSEQVPGTPERPVPLLGSYTAVEPLEDLVSGPLVPKLSPPGSLRIDWNPAGAPHRVDSVHPVISWRPPAVGTPTAYEVVVRQFLPGVGWSPRQGALYVPGSLRDVRLPPGMLRPGAYFFVNVTAIDAPLWDVEHAPLATKDRAPYRSATAFSSLFSVAP